MSRYCPNCGTEILGEGRYCPGCRRAVFAEEATTPQQQTQQAVSAGRTIASPANPTTQQAIFTPPQGPQPLPRASSRGLFFGGLTLAAVLGFVALGLYFFPLGGSSPEVGIEEERSLKQLVQLQVGVFRLRGILSVNGEDEENQGFHPSEGGATESLSMMYGRASYPDVLHWLAAFQSPEEADRFLEKDIDRLISEQGFTKVNEGHVGTQQAQNDGTWVQLQNGNSEILTWTYGRLWAAAVAPPGASAQFYRNSQYGFSLPRGTGDGDIFWDDFSSSTSKLRASKGGSISFDYNNGSYRIYNPPPADTVAALVDDAGSIEDAIVEGDATITGAAPSDVSSWGVVCRARDATNYYGMGIYNDGRSYIMKMKDGKTSNLAWGGFSDAIRKHPATNHIGGGCVGRELTLYVNGRRLLLADDTEFVSGRVGMYASHSGDELPLTDVSFENFLVSKP